VDAAVSIAQRLRLTNEISEGLSAAHQMIQELPGMAESRPSQITAYLDPMPAVALFVVDLIEPAPEVKGIIASYLTTWRNIWPVTTGSHLREMDIQPGPSYRSILKNLRDAWLDGQISSVAEEKKLLQELIDHLPAA
jgi:hypothetical protein